MESPMALKVLAACKINPAWANKLSNLSSATGIIREVSSHTKNRSNKNSSSVNRMKVRSVNYLASSPPPALVQSQFTSLPAYLKAAEFRKKVAVSDNDGNFLYEDILRRSMDLAAGITDLLKQSPPLSKSRQYRVAFLCPNGASHVITQWACWMAGGVAVPLDHSMSQEKIEHVVNEARCDLVIAAKVYVDKINEVCKKSGRRLICLDHTWTANPKKEFEEARELPSSYKEIRKKDVDKAMMLYTDGKDSRRVTFTHSQLNAQTDIVSSTWDLTDKCSMLHALPVDNPYGIVTAMMAPLSVGGRVVMLSKFDAVKVWSYLLGIGVNTSQALPKVNLFPSTPPHLRLLLDRHATVFADKKTKAYVRSTCKKRLRAMTSSLGVLDAGLRSEWKAATGHDVVDCYTSAETGTVLSQRIDGGLASSSEENEDKGMETMMGVYSRIVRYRDSENSKYHILDHNATSVRACSGALLLRSPGAGVTHGVPVAKDGWIHTGKEAKVAKGKIHVEQ